MSKSLMALTGLFFFVSAAANPFDGATIVKFDSICMDAKSLIAMSEKYQEVPMMRGTSARAVGNELIEQPIVLFSNPREWSWTLWERINEDFYCIIGFGKNLEPVPAEDREKFLGKSRPGM
jgi:hypothetical protein